VQPQGLRDPREERLDGRVLPVGVVGEMKLH
jgi:hypothetical protein